MEHDCFELSKVVDSRYSNRSKSLRRRRQCTSCNHRFTTKEAVAESILTEEQQLDHKNTMLKLLKNIDKEFKKFSKMVGEL